MLEDFDQLTEDHALLTYLSSCESSCYDCSYMYDQHQQYLTSNNDGMEADLVIAGWTENIWTNTTFMKLQY